MKTFIKELKEKKVQTCASLGAAVTTYMTFMPIAQAFADNGSDTFNKAKNILAGGGGAIGAIIAIFGVINLGLTIKDGMQGGGGQLAGAIAMIVGGIIVCAGSVMLSSVDTNWTSGGTTTTTTT